MSKLGKLLRNNIRNNFIIIMFIIIFLLMGIIFGVVGVKALSPEQLDSLNNYIDTGLSKMKNYADYNSTIQFAIFRNLKMLGKLWFLGLTVIGLPLILVIIFARGFVLGFTVGFFLEKKAVQGIGLIMLSILPHNLIYLPALIASGTTAVVFSLFLIKGSRRESVSISRSFLSYSFFMAFLALIMVFAGIIEGYFSPLAAKTLNIW